MAVEPASRLASLVDRSFAAYNARDLDAYEALMDPEIEFVMSGMVVRGIEAVMDLTKVTTEASPSLRIERRRVFSEVGDTIVIELRMVDGATPDPGTGPAPSTACALYRIVDDRIVEFRVYHDPVAEDLAWAALVAVAAEQSALRRVAESVARRAPAEQIFELVTDELSRLLEVDVARMVRFDPDDTVTTLASAEPAEGTTGPPDPGTLIDEVRRTGRSARIESATCAAAGPIIVDGRVWGAMIVAFSGREALPAGIEARVAQFAELVSTAISNVAAHEQLSQVVAEQTALRRVATLVAREYSPEELFAAVARELGELLAVDAAAILRYGPGAATPVAEWSNGSVSIELGVRLPLDGDNLASRVLRTGKAHRKEDYSAAAGEIASTVRRHGIRSAVASPIVVRGEIWGVIAVLSRGSEPLPSGTESRLAEFSRHAAMAVANANSRAELAQSRARVVRAADEARRRFERNLHDGAQQRLVSLALELMDAESTVPGDLEQARQALAHVGAGLREVLDELRELSRGLHPSLLSEAGLVPALRSLSRRSPVPVELRLDLAPQRLPELVEVAAYYAVSEALANTAKHAGASHVDVSVARGDDRLQLTIADDGRGGADPAHGSGLTGLADRVEAIGGTLRIDSPEGVGTTLSIGLPTAAVG
jgi:signal transduction histidine kinase